MTIHFKRHRHTDENVYVMLICGMHKQQRQQQTKQKTILDYLGGSSVQKSTCSHQLGSSLQLGLMS
jgi:hypothetical protein